MGLLLLVLACRISFNILPCLLKSFRLFWALGPFWAHGLILGLS